MLLHETGTCTCNFHSITGRLGLCTMAMLYRTASRCVKQSDCRNPKHSSVQSALLCTLSSNHWVNTRIFKSVLLGSALYSRQPSGCLDRKERIRERRTVSRAFPVVMALLFPSAALLAALFMLMLSAIWTSSGPTSLQGRTSTSSDVDQL